jgi:hypothetical protein
MSPDRPEAGGDERDDEFTEMPGPCLKNPGTPPQFPQRDTTAVASYAAGTGPQRRAGPGFPACEPWCDCGRQAAVPVAATLPE